MNEVDEMPLPYVRALTNEVKETKKVIEKTRSMMEIRKIENEEYYEPANVLFESVRNTRKEFNERADAVLEKINSEREELVKLKMYNEENLEELQRSAEVFERDADETRDTPLGIAIRAIAAMLPFAAFGFVAICTKESKQK